MSFVGSLVFESEVPCSTGGCATAAFSTTQTVWREAIFEERRKQQQQKWRRRSERSAAMSHRCQKPPGCGAVFAMPSTLGAHKKACRAIRAAASERNTSRIRSDLTAKSQFPFRAYPGGMLIGDRPNNQGSPQAPPDGPAAGQQPPADSSPLDNEEDPAQGHWNGAAAIDHNPTIIMSAAAIEGLLSRAMRM